MSVEINYWSSAPTGTMDFQQDTVFAAIQLTSIPFFGNEGAANKSVDKGHNCCTVSIRFFPPMLAPPVPPSALAGSAPIVLQFPTEATRAVRSLRNMTTQLLQEAAQVIPNQQLLINVVSKRVRQLGLGHRPMVEAGPRTSLTDIALKEIIAGKLSFESLKGSPDGA